MDEYELILATCLDEIAAGTRTVADCIAQYPDTADELTELSETIAHLQQTAAAHVAAPSAAFRAETTDRLLAKIAAEQAPSPTQRPRKSLFGRIRTALAAPPRVAWAFAMTAVLLIAGFLLTITAQYGSLMHPAKVGITNQLIRSENDPAEKLARTVTALEQRVDELEKLPPATQQTYLPAATSDFMALGSQANALLSTLAQTNENAPLINETSARIRAVGGRIRALKDRAATAEEGEAVAAFEDVVAAVAARQTWGIEANKETFIRNIIDENPQFSEIKALLQWQEDDTFNDVWDQLGQGDAASGYTLFLPDNSAMRNSAAQLTPLRTNKEVVRELLLYHRLIGEFELERLINSGSIVPTQGCQPLTFTQDGDEWLINDTVRVNAQMIPARNGRIYLIDRVLVPTAFWSIPDSGCGIR